jgi:hypothetical protein
MSAFDSVPSIEKLKDELIGNISPLNFLVEGQLGLAAALLSDVEGSMPFLTVLSRDYWAIRFNGLDARITLSETYDYVSMWDADHPTRAFTVKVTSHAVRFGVFYLYELNRLNA